MAQTGYTPIQLYRTATASATPTAGNLADGELAINTNDGKLFYKDSGGVVQTLASKGSGTIGGSNTQIQFNNSGALGASANLTWDGTTLTSANSVTSPVHKSATTLTFQTNGTTTGMYIDASQNVGIGTTSPGSKLAVVGDITNYGAGTDAYLNLKTAYTTAYVAWTNASSTLSLWNVLSGSVIIGTNNAERMRIDSAGNVGIGTSSPSTYGKLGIVTADGTAGVVASGATGMLRMYGYTSISGGAYIDSANAAQSAYLPIQINGSYSVFATGGIERMRIDSSGNVNIATSGVSAKLYVNGNAASVISALTDGVTITPDFSTANNFSVTLAGNRTLANPTNLTAGQSGIIYVSQDATGGRTLAYGSYWKFPNGAAPTLTTTASAVDALVYTVRSSTSITVQSVLNIG